MRCRSRNQYKVGLCVACIRATMAVGWDLKWGRYRPPSFSSTILFPSPAIAPTLFPGPDLSVWRPWAGSLLEARVAGCWCGCLSGARCRQLYDLHINSMTYTLFFIPDYNFQKIFFYVSLGNIFYCFCGGPLVVEAPGQLLSLPPLKSGPA